MFFQAVPNAVAGYVAARRGAGRTRGVSRRSTAAGLDAAALLIEDGDADEALLVADRPGRHRGGTPDRAGRCAGCGAPAEPRRQ